MAELSRESEFEDLYFKVREKEIRIYSDKEVSELPSITKGHVYYSEWLVRKNSLEKLTDYLKKKNNTFHILDIGCGNGWLSDKLTQINNSTVTAVDVNKHEIDQARRVFKHNKNVTFVYNELQNILSGNEKFDIIVLTASVQYFPDLKALLKNLLLLLTDTGEIHILDSPFYYPHNIDKAKNASLTYYSKLGYPVMAAFYHHHLWLSLNSFNFEIKKNTFFSKILGKLSNNKVGYFPWIIVRK